MQKLFHQIYAYICHAGTTSAIPKTKKNVFSFFSASHLNTGFIKHQCLFSKMLSCDTHVGDAILNSAHVIS